MFIRSRKPTEAATIPLEIGGLRVRPSARAKRMGLRVEARTGDVVFTWPLKSRLTPDRALKFIEDNRGWIAQQKSQAVAPKIFAPGAVVPVGGKNYTIVHAAGRGLTRFEDDRLIVHGQPEHVARRVKDFLKGVALDTLTRLTQEKSASLGLKNASVRILDPKSRWGSCAPGGRIMYSWRLILAPYAVMDYVVAHEVAHRVHMDHSRQFWRVCVTLAPKSRECRAWLRREGRELLAWR
ncbi:MAG TPA: SprT family zinc-dependent metalloprotease [Patescibacteria group bacterium]|nr:SprT family zinc-dependent metalloprotease [Patescibacteria group bacterium]